LLLKKKMMKMISMREKQMATSPHNIAERYNPSSKSCTMCTTVGKREFP
jgi:hypothetical protein